MKDKIIELLKQYEDTHTQGVYRCDYDELADEVVKLFCQPAVSGRSEQLPRKSKYCVSISPEPCKHKGVCEICSK